MKRVLFIVVIALLAPVAIHSQSLLEIQTNAGYIPPYNTGTGYNIDSIYGEVSGCGITEHLYAFVIDTPSSVAGGCQPWETNYNNSNPGHDFGNIMTCRARPEAYFQYNQSDPTGMQSLDSLINLWVPNGYIIGIYSWRGYNYTSINSSSPALANTLFNYWGINATSNHSAVIFYAVKGDPSSYDMIYSNDSPDTIMMVKQICQSASINAIQGNNNSFFNIYPNPFASSINISGCNTQSIIITNLYGEVVHHSIANGDNIILNTEAFKSGMYILRAGNVTRKIFKY